MSCGVGRRCGSDLALLWLWCRPAATAPIQPLALGTSICHGSGPRKGKKTKKKEKRRKEILELFNPLILLKETEAQAFDQGVPKLEGGGLGGEKPWPPP